MSFKLLLSIIIVSLLIASSLIGYRLMLVDPVPDTSTDSGVTSSSKAATGSAVTSDPENAEFTRLLRSIAKITALKTELFTKAEFVSLTSFIFPIPTPNPGRNNPFAPIGL